MTRQAEIFDEYCKRDRYFRGYGGIGFGKSYLNNNLKGKKMNTVFEVLAIQEQTDGSPAKILVPITIVIATTETAVQNFTIENAEALKGKENVQILCRPFC